MHTVTIAITYHRAMKIHSQNLVKNKYWILIVILSLVLIFVEELPIELENPEMYKFIRASGYFLQALCWIKSFWSTIQSNQIKQEQ